MLIPGFGSHIETKASFTLPYNFIYNYLECTRLDIRRDSGGTHVQSMWILDRNYGNFLLSWPYASNVFAFLCTNDLFVLLSYLKLSERMYIYVFGAYLTVFFAGFSYWSVFMMTPGTAH